MQETSTQTHPLRRGVIVFVALALLTLAEYGVAVGLDGNVPLLTVVALIKAGLIVWYYMHIKHVFNTGEGGH